MQTDSKQCNTWVSETGIKHSGFLVTEESVISHYQACGILGLPSVWTLIDDVSVLDLPPTSLSVASPNFSVQQGRVSALDQHPVGATLFSRFSEIKQQQSKITNIFTTQLTFHSPLFFLFHDRSLCVTVTIYFSIHILNCLLLSYLLSLNIFSSAFARSAWKWTVQENTLQLPFNV
jgi:hypothetical protein